jgi:transcription initiation factor TFIIIB Brf1 subunit/transcription initiation factor TFIIB
MGDLYQQIEGQGSRSVLDCPLMGPKGCGMLKLWKGDWSGVEMEYSVEGFTEGRTKQHTKVASCKICGEVFADAAHDFYVGDQDKMAREAYKGKFTDITTGGAEKNRLFSGIVLEKLAAKLGFDWINYGNLAFTIFNRLTEAGLAVGRGIALVEAVSMYVALTNKGNTRITLREVCDAHRFSLIQAEPGHSRMDWGELNSTHAERLLRKAVKMGLVDYNPVKSVEVVIRNSDTAKEHMDEEIIARAIEISELNKTISRTKNIAAAVTYMAIKEAKPSLKLTQKQISKDFGVAERSLRHSIKATKEAMFGPTPKRNPSQETGQMPGSYVRLLRDIRSQNNGEPF